MSANGVLLSDDLDQVSTPDAAKFTIAGDLDVRAKVALVDWTPASQGLVAAHSSAIHPGWFFSVLTDGTLRFSWSADGTNSTTVPSTVATGVSDGSTKWIRVVHDVDNGASGNDTKFYTSDDGSSWAQLGSTVTTAATTSHFDTTASVNIGAAGASNGMVGTVYKVEILDGIAGTIIANPDFVNDPAASESTVRDSRGNLWTLANGAAFVLQVKPAAVGLAI